MPVVHRGARAVGEALVRAQNPLILSAAPSPPPLPPPPSHHHHHCHHHRLVGSGGRLVLNGRLSPGIAYVTMTVLANMQVPLPLHIIVFHIPNPNNPTHLTKPTKPTEPTTSARRTCGTYSAGRGVPLVQPSYVRGGCHAEVITDYMQLESVVVLHCWNTLV